MKSPICLILSFNWPRPFNPEHGALAKELHNRLQGQDWIEERARSISKRSKEILDALA